MSTDGTLAGKRVAMFVEDEFEDRELIGPLEALRAAGAIVHLVGPSAGAEYTGKRGQATVKSDVAAGSVKLDDFDALVIPGGHAPDKMRMRHAMVDLARDAMQSGKPVAAICHGPQVLISANVLRGRTLTCWPSIAVDVKNAGGLYVDKPVVEDGNLITSRKADVQRSDRQGPQQILASRTVCVRSLWPKRVARGPQGLRLDGRAATVRKPP
jgi:protease I